MIKMFNTQGYVNPDEVPDGLFNGVNFSALPPFLRVLLTADGTVTKSLESYFWEPVKVQLKCQEEHLLKQNLQTLNKSQGEQVFLRHVHLVGEHSELTYGRAESYICHKALPKTLATDLVSGRLGIGELLRHSSIETYREIIDYGCQTRSGEGVIMTGGEHVGHQSLRTLEVWRTYIISMGQVPAIQITEYFPISVYLPKP